ncbi:hypothetical protein ES703_120999 [subsurface metagenome]
MTKNILACDNKNRRTLRYYLNPYEESVFNSFNLNNNKRVEDGCLKEKDSFQIKTQKLYDTLNEVKEKLKKIDWNKVSNNWEVSFRKNQYSDYVLVNFDFKYFPSIRLLLDIPHSGCLAKNFSIRYRCSIIILLWYSPLSTTGLA